eukprot:scaffold49809_cov43-Attheya_sp.AAC.2
MGKLCKGLGSRMQIRACVERPRSQLLYIPSYDQTPLFNAWNWFMGMNPHHGARHAAGIERTNSARWRHTIRKWNL